MDERQVLLSVMALTLASHAVNLFRYPLYLGDEGIYMQQAWSVLREQQLSPYTYFYDHAPGGWLMLAAWAFLLPGGFGAFDMSVNTGRVLMLALHLSSTLMLFRILRHMSGGLIAPLVGGIVFSLSPLAVYYQRMILLDNQVVFWVLLSIYFLVCHGNRLAPVLASALCFGAGMLTKENTLFFAPVLFYIVMSQFRHHYSSRFATTGWIMITVMLVSFYPMFALLKGELLPGEDHVSLVGTILWQLGRKGGSIADPNSQFWQFFWGKWWFKDQIIIALGAGSVALCLLLGYGDRHRYRAHWFGGLLALAFALYLTRGSVVLEFYVVPILPFLAWCAGMSAEWVIERLPKLLAVPAFGVGLAALTGGFLLGSHDHYFLPLTPLQQAQLAWVRQNVPPTARMITDDDLWVDLHEPNSAGPVYPNAHSYSKVAGDPAVRDRVFRNDWKNVDYLMMSNKMLEEMQRQGSPLPLLAHQNSQEVARFELGDVALEVRKVNKNAK
ncbi:MAG: glycosyltransferase family 39 protein [Chloroflexi bacterium]|nr:glycosyltransferase family 39 protein [Chloroflexota bacterium]